MKRFYLLCAPGAAALAIVALWALLQAPTQAALEAGAASTQTTSAAMDLIGAAQPTPSPNCRYGVDALAQNQLNWLPVLGTGWYSDFAAHAPAPAVPAEFVQVLGVSQKRNGCTYFDDYSTAPPLTDTGLGNIIDASRGALWLIGNEPDRGPNPEDVTCKDPTQGNTFPEVYARAYHDAYTFIKSRDPSAQVANAGLVEVTPGRLQYLDKVWEAYRQRYGTTMPVDVWNMHLYILPEALPDGQPNGIANIALGTDPALAIRESGGNPANCGNHGIYCWAQHDSLAAFDGQVTAMRTWMKQHGQQNKPLILSEYSILYPFQDYDDPVNPTTCFLQDEYDKCFTQQRIAAFMNSTFSYLESAVDPSLGYPLDQYRLVQRWMWYSLNTSQVGQVSNLITDNLLALTQPGQAFQTFVLNHATYQNLRPDNAPPVTAILPAASSTATVTLQVRVVNSGDGSIKTPFGVMFYADSALTQPIGYAVVTPPLGGCERQAAMAKVTWSDVPVGAHRFWLKVDFKNVVAESDEGDNVISGTATIYPAGIFLPLLFRG